MKLRRSACIDTLYLELPFLDRFQAAKEDGFDAVEFWSWADRDLSAVKSASDRAGIPVCGFNGDADLSLIDPAQREAYLAFLHRSLEAARFLGASGVTVHSNGLGPGGVVLAPREDLSHTVKLCSLYAGPCRQRPPGGGGRRHPLSGTAEHLHRPPRQFSAGHADGGGAGTPDRLSPPEGPV